MGKKENNRGETCRKHGSSVNALANGASLSKPDSQPFRRTVPPQTMGCLSPVMGWVPSNGLKVPQSLFSGKALAELLSGLVVRGLFWIIPEAT